MAPNGFHIFPVLYYAMFYRVFKFQNALILFRAFSNENVLLVLSDHDFLVHWAADAKFKVRADSDTYYELKTKEGSESPAIPAFICPEPYKLVRIQLNLHYQLLWEP